MTTPFSVCWHPILHATTYFLSPPQFLCHYIFLSLKTFHSEQPEKIFMKIFSLATMRLPFPHEKIFMNTCFRMEMEAALSLLCLHRSAQKRVMPSLKIQPILYRVYQLASRGFAHDHLVRAGYPRILSELMWNYELAYPNHLNPASPHAYAPYTFRPNPHSSESPHVVCPTCKGPFALQTNNTLRKHACYPRISRDSSPAPQDLITAVRELPSALVKRRQ